MNPIDKNKHYLPVDLLKDRVYIDIEATKTLVPLEVSLIDYKGEVMFSSLIRPDDTFLKNNKNSKQHVGISDDDLIRAKYTWPEANLIIRNMLRGRIVWAYNLEYDERFFPCRLTCAFNSYCAKQRFANYYGDYRLNWRGTYRNNLPKWQQLQEAASVLGITDFPQKHRSLDDAQLLRKIVLELDNIEITKKCGIIEPTYNLEKAIDKNQVINFQDINHG